MANVQSELLRGLPAYFKNLGMGFFYLFGIFCLGLLIAFVHAAAQSKFSYHMAILLPQLSLLTLVRSILEPRVEDFNSAIALGKLLFFAYCMGSAALAIHMLKNVRLKRFEKIVWCVLTISASLCLAPVIPAWLYVLRNGARAGKSLVWIFISLLSALSILVCFTISLSPLYFVSIVLFCLSFPMFYSEKVALWFESSVISPVLRRLGPARSALNESRAQTMLLNDETVNTLDTSRNTNTNTNTNSNTETSASALQREPTINPPAEPVLRLEMEAPMPETINTASEKVPSLKHKRSSS